MAKIPLRFWGESKKFEAFDHQKESFDRQRKAFDHQKESFDRQKKAVTIFEDSKKIERKMVLPTHTLLRLGLVTN